MSDCAPTVGFIERFMVEDHARVDRLLEAAEGGAAIDAAAYEGFRHDLLRHIGMEEKVLLPYARRKRAGDPLPLAAALRADHSEIARLLVRSPSRPVIDALRELLARHNQLEEGPEGLYAACDALAGEEGAEIVAQLRARPRVPLAPYYDGPFPQPGESPGRKAPGGTKPGST
jgi:hypothetical protein